MTVSIRLHKSIYLKQQFLLDSLQNSISAFYNILLSGFSTLSLLNHSINNCNDKRQHILKTTPHRKMDSSLEILESREYLFIICKIFSIRQTVPHLSMQQMLAHEIWATYHFSRGTFCTLVLDGCGVSLCILEFLACYFHKKKPLSNSMGPRRRTSSTICNKP